MIKREDDIKETNRAVLSIGKLFLLTLIIAVTTAARSNDIPWTYKESTNFDVIEILPDRYPIEVGDVIGIFAINPQTTEKHCIGYLVWDGELHTFNAYGFDGNNGEFVKGSYFLKLYKEKYDCIIDLEFTPEMGSSGNFVGNGFKSILKITSPISIFVDASFSLFDITDETCDEDGQIQYIENTVIGRYKPFQFSLFDNTGSKIATNDNGYYRGLEAGDYIFEVTDTRGCKSTKNITVDAKFLDISTISLETEDDICNEGGSLFIDTTTLLEGTPPYSFLIKNQFTGLGINSTKCYLTDIEDGSYYLEVIDDNGCREQTEFTILPDDFDCNENNILAPLSADPAANQISFDCNDNIKVLDENGAVVKLFNGDGSWNGTDASGGLVPNGTYFIYCGTQYLKSIEVLK